MKDLILLSIFLTLSATLKSQNEGIVFPMTPDTIEVRGNYLSGCKIPGAIKIAEHNELGGAYRSLTVDTNGEFKSRFYLAEPRRIEIKTEKYVRYSFIATTKDKVYQIEIPCVNGMEKPELKNSAENSAYQPFRNANKKFVEDLNKIGKEDLKNPEVFEKLKSTILEYQKTLEGIASANPNTFTAKVLCASEKLPEGSLKSLETLRKNFLQRNAFSNPQLYNDFLARNILANYLAIRDEQAATDETVNNLFALGTKNIDAAKRLQEIAYDAFSHSDDLMTSYIKWLDANDALMYNTSVKGRLQSLKKSGSMPGNTYKEIKLKDPSGAIRSLSATVDSSKLTLLVFYGPTCSHCQAEIPTLKPIWDQYKMKGLKIFLAGYEGTNEEWNAFIKSKASPEWVHVFDPGQIAVSQYNAYTTPTYVLIDEQGKIISRLAPLEHVKKLISEKLK